jgi:hypothetical protein
MMKNILFLKAFVVQDDNGELWAYSDSENRLFHIGAELECQLNGDDNGYDAESLTDAIEQLIDMGYLESEE